MTLRALMITAAIGASAGPGLAQQSGSIDLRIGGQDRNFAVLPEESGIEVAAGPGERIVTLMAAPEVPDEDAEARLMIRFAVEGLSIGATASAPEIRYEDGRDAIWSTAGALTGSISITSFTEIGRSFVVTGDFSSELASETPEAAVQTVPSGAAPADAAAPGTVVAEGTQPPAGAAAPETVVAEGTAPSTGAAPETVVVEGAQPQAGAAAPGTVVVEGAMPTPAAGQATGQQDAATQAPLVQGTAQATPPVAGTPPQPQGEVLGVSGRFQATLTGE